MFVFILMSHGSSGNLIYGTDKCEIKQHEIFKRIYECEALKGKPKFIVVKACAGDNLAEYSYDSGPGPISPGPISPGPISPGPISPGPISPDPNPSASNTCMTVTAARQDVLTLNSAPDGYASLRHHKLGSPFIRALVVALYKFSHNCDLVTICEKVKKAVTHLKNPEFQRLAQPCYNSDLEKKLYLLPGITYNGSPGRSQYIYASYPQSLNHEKSGGTSDVGYRWVRWIDDDRMVAGGIKMIEIIDKHLQKISYVVPTSCCTDVIPFKDQLFVLEEWSHEGSGSQTINLYTLNLQKLRSISGPSTKSHYNSQIATTGDIIFTSDRTNKCVHARTKENQPKKLIELSDMTCPTGLCITKDGDLLICDYASKGSVRKYQKGLEYSFGWRSDELKWPLGIAEDSRRLVYVSRCFEGLSAVYVLSSDGVLLREITDDELTKSHIYGISVVSDTLAVACGPQGLKLFTLKF